MNGMVAQIHSIPELIRSVVRSYDETIRNTLDHNLCLSVKRIYLTGCGDSHHASIGSEMAFEHIAGIPTEALPSLQFARYTVDTIPHTEPGTNIVIGTSVSGEVSRTLEALLLARQAGATTIAMTATPGSRIGKAVDIMVNTTQPPFQDPPGMLIPGVRSYVANQIGLLLTAIRIGEVRGHIASSEAEAFRKEIGALGDAAEKTIESTDQAACKLARDWKDSQEFVFVGSGPNYASALFSAAKMLEASGDPAMGQDTEEWAHLQYFARSVKTPTFLISAGGRDLSRVEEISVAARTIGRRIAAVVPASATGVIAQADIVLPLAEGMREMFSPVITAIPGSLFAAYRSDNIGEPFFRGFGGGRSEENGGGISRIRTSKVIDLNAL